VRYRIGIISIGLLIVATVLVLSWLQKHNKINREQIRVSSASGTAANSFPSSGHGITAKSASPSGQRDEVHRRETVAKITTVLATPIEFYGKVVDQNGDPVSEAKVDYGTIDRFDANGSNYRGRSHEDGNFSISGIKGAVLTVGVQKEGYYNIHGKSDAAFAYGVGPDATRKEPPTKDNPAVFVLQKKGLAEPLIRAGGGQIDIPRTGEPLSIDLATGKPGRGDLQIEAWIGDSSQPRFDWRYRLSIPGGGLHERKGQFDFEAPSDGYESFVEINMPANAGRWSSDVPKQYFAKLPNGTYARFSTEFYAGDRNFIVFESYLNPRPGSRNLEFDPQKTVKVR
jgi:hypothetical protein